MKTIDVATIRKVLKREKLELIQSVERNWKAGRVNLSSETASHLARVLLLESLVDGSILLEDESQPTAGAQPGNNTLDL